MGFMTLKKGQPLTDEEIALLSTRKGRSYAGGDSGTGGHGGNSAGGSDGGSSSGNDGSSGSGGTGTANASTASNNNKPGTSSSVDLSGSSDEDGDGIGLNGMPTSSSITTGSYSDDQAADFGNPGSYDRASNDVNSTYGEHSYSGLSYSPIKTSYWDNDQAVDFNDIGSWADTASSTKDTTYGGDSSSIFDSIKSYVLENPLTVAGSLLGLAISGPMGALSIGSLGSTADDIANPETSGLDKAISVMRRAGMPGLMGITAKGIAKAAEMMGGENPNPGVNPDRTTAGNRTAAESKLNYTAPKVEYKFDPFTQSNGLMGSNGKISYSQLHKLVNQFKKQSGGLMSSLSNRSLTGGV